MNCSRPQSVKRAICYPTYNLVSMIIPFKNDIGLLPDTQNRGLRMHREYRERFPRHRLQKKPLVSDPGIHHGTCVTHVPWCMSGSLNRSGGGKVPGIPGACATRNFTYLARGPCIWGDDIHNLSFLHGYIVSYPKCSHLRAISTRRF